MKVRCFAVINVVDDICVYLANDMNQTLEFYYKYAEDYAYRMQFTNRVNEVIRLLRQDNSASAQELLAEYDNALLSYSRSSSNLIDHNYLAYKIARMWRYAWFRGLTTSPIEYRDVTVDLEFPSDVVEIPAVNENRSIEISANENTC